MADYSRLRKESYGFAFPIIAELFLMSLISMANLALVGHLGAQSLAAVGLSSQPVAISLVLFHGISVGASALVARSIGAREKESAQKVVAQTLYLSLVSGLLIGGLVWIWAEPIVVLMGAQPETLEAGLLYLRYMAGGMVLQSLPTGVTALLRGAGDSRSPMNYNIVTNLVNLGLGLAFIHGISFLRFPGLGLEGAAIATTLAKLVNTFLALKVLFKREGVFRVALPDLVRPDWIIIRKILDIGISAAAEGLAMRIGFLVYSRIIADLGTLSFASHQIVLSVTGFGSNIVQGISAAAGSLTGRSLGAGEVDTAKTYNRILLNLGLGISFVFGILFFTQGELVASLFTGDLEVIGLTGRVLVIAALITFPQSYLSILSGALRGAGDTRWTLYSALLGVTIARTGLAWLFVLHLGLGLEGAWLAALADQSIRAVVIILRYRNGGWARSLGSS